MSDVFLSRPAASRPTAMLRRLLERAGLRFPITIPSPFFIARSGEWAQERPATVAHSRPIEEEGAFRTDLAALARTLEPMAEERPPEEAGPEPRSRRRAHQRAELTAEQKQILRGQKRPPARKRPPLAARLLEAAGISLPIRIASPFYLSRGKSAPRARPRQEPPIARPWRDDLRRLRGQAETRAG